MNSDLNISINTSELSTLRLYMMRGLYFLTFIGLAFDAWSTILYPGEMMDTITGVAFSFWASYATLMGLGIRYPKKMLPLLLLQLLYKSIWILGVYLPMRSAGEITPHAESFFWICVTAVILDTIVIPWPYVIKTYFNDFFKLRKVTVNAE